MATIKDIVITSEMEAKLKGFAPIRSDGTFEYVPIAYREAPEQIRPTFTLKELSGLEAVETGDAMRGEMEVDTEGKRKINIRQGSFTIAVCRRGIQGWRNYFDLSTGNEVPFNRDLSRLPRDLLYELCNAILSGSALGKEEVAGLK